MNPEQVEWLNRAIGILRKGEAIKLAKDNITVYKIPRYFQYQSTVKNECIIRIDIKEEV